eukprot:1060260-Rhodomonas_salina.1
MCQRSLARKRAVLRQRKGQVSKNAFPQNNPHAESSTDIDHATPGSVNLVCTLIKRNLLTRRSTEVDLSGVEFEAKVYKLNVVRTNARAVSILIRMLFLSRMTRWESRWSKESRGKELVSQTETEGEERGV